MQILINVINVRLHLLRITSNIIGYIIVILLQECYHFTNYYLMDYWTMEFSLVFAAYPEIIGYSFYTLLQRKVLSKVDLFLEVVSCWLTGLVSFKYC